MSNNKTNKTVRLNVGGHLYEVPKSLLEQYPNTMLARLVDKKWNNSQEDDDDHDNDNDEPIFIDRDGERFRYVLDLLRDRKVFLPLSESHEAFLVDLEYFNLQLEDTKDDEAPLFDIQYGSLAEVSNLVQVIEANEDDELQALEDTKRKYKAAIEECSKKQSTIKTANLLFRRSSKREWTTTTDANTNKPGSWEQTTVKIENPKAYDQSVDQQAFNDAQTSLVMEDFLRQRLEAFGLVLVQASGESHKYCKFLLERKRGTTTQKKKANNNNKDEEASIDDNKKSSPPSSSRQQPKRKRTKTRN